MGIWQRIKTLFKSNINAAISDAEDPQKMLEQAILDMQQQMAEARKQVSSSIADEKRLARQLQEQRELGADWEKKAELAVRAGDDSLAREALKRKAEHDSHAAELDKQWQIQKAAIDKLKDQLRVLNDKLEEAKRKKNILIARQKRAEAQKSIQETMKGLSDTSAFDTFDRMAAKVDQIEAEADAATELNDELSGDTLSQKFKALSQSDAAGDDALAALKAKMGVGPALPAAASRPALAGTPDRAALPPMADSAPSSNQSSNVPANVRKP